MCIPKLARVFHSKRRLMLPLSDATLTNPTYPKKISQSFNLIEWSRTNFPSKFRIEIGMRVDYSASASFFLSQPGRVKDLRCKLTAKFSRFGLLILCNPKSSLIYVASFSPIIVSLITLGAVTAFQGNRTSFPSDSLSRLSSNNEHPHGHGLDCFPGVHTSTNYLTISSYLGILKGASTYQVALSVSFVN